MVESITRAEIALPARRAFARATAMRNHERLVPFTRIEVPDGVPRVGDVAVATSVLVLRDVMELLAYDEPGGDMAGDRPGRAHWVKRGPVLLGEAEIRVSPVAPGRAEITWVERDIRLAPDTDGVWTSPLLTAASGLMTRFALSRLTRLTEATR